MTAGPARSEVRVDHYDWAGGREAMLRFGPDNGPVVVVAPPLFEEANRTRAVVVAMLRGLAARGIGGALPDLPGQNESSVETRDAGLDDWRAAFASAAAALPGPVHTVAMRGGALVDGGAEAASRWYLSPIEGSAVVRELGRARTLGGDGLFFGNALAPDLLTTIEAAEPMTTGRLRVVRLAGDPRPADAILAFLPPWRAAEPRGDDLLTAAIADDIAAWVNGCDG